MPSERGFPAASVKLSRVLLLSGFCDISSSVTDFSFFSEPVTFSKSHLLNIVRKLCKILTASMVLIK